MANKKRTTVDQLKMAVLRCYAAATSKISELSEAVTEAIEELDNSKAETQHTHAISEVKDLSTNLSDKVSKTASSTLSDGVSLTLTKFANRTLTITGNDITADMSKVSGGWAGNFASLKDPAGVTTSMLGWYGGESGVTHIFMGGTYNDPFLKFTPSGQYTFKVAPKVGTDTVALKSDIGDINTILDSINGEEI